MVFTVLQMKVDYNVFWLVVVSLLMAVACKNEKSQPAKVPEALTRFRTEQDFYFRKNISSPYYGKADFNGIRYFEYAPQWAVNCIFVPALAVSIVTFTNTDGSAEEFRVMGKALLQYPERVDTLVLYKQVKVKNSNWFLPFYDATNGVETYSGGRYLDVTPVESGKSVLLDFNYAYHPLCVHDAVTVCPLPPAHNVVHTRVEAGERLME
jgi:uncharacterized protein (DUF1684 family)